MSEINYILDASAVLALVHGEPGADVVESCVTQGAAICAVNLSEVVAKCTDLGLDAEAFRVWFARLGIVVLPADEALSFVGGCLVQAPPTGGGVDHTIRLMAHHLLWPLE